MSPSLTPTPAGGQEKVPGLSGWEIATDAAPSVNWSMVGRCTRLLKESVTEDFLRCLGRKRAAGHLGMVSTCPAQVTFLPPKSCSSSTEGDITKAWGSEGSQCYNFGKKNKTKNKLLCCSESQCHDSLCLSPWLGGVDSEVAQVQ